MREMRVLTPVWVVVKGCRAWKQGVEGLCKEGGGMMTRMVVVVMVVHIRERWFLY
jgi:hypothetical protein